MKRLGFVVLATTLTAACHPKETFVKVPDVALGRVVVYRNGVAYYERHARVEGDRLSVMVPHDKVDDFLKSLTVLDAKTRKPLDVAFPRHDMAGTSNVEMAIQLPKDGPTEVILTYITEAPAWKPSYRVVMSDDGKVELQGWAVVDNTSGEDWNDIIVGVGSSSALSFRYDLWSVRNVHRQTLASEDRFAVAPPTGGSPTRDGGGPQVVTVLADAEIPRPPGHPDRAEEEVMAMSPKSGGGRAAQAASRPPRTYGDKQKVKDLATSLRAQKKQYVIQGYSGAGESRAKAEERANLLRNELIANGVAPAQIGVDIDDKPANVASGGVRIVVANEATGDGAGGEGAAARAAAELDQEPVGESHFGSTRPITVKRGTSVMVSVVKQGTEGEVVYLYDAESERGNGRYAFKAVRFENPTGSTLETGPLTVFGDGRFIGEGLADPIPPRATAVVPFALDRQIVATREKSTRDRIDSLVTLSRGALTANVKHVRRTELKLHNRLRTKAKVYVRHTVEKGWKVVHSPKVVEQLGDAHLFLVELGPSQTLPVVIEEETPLVRTVDLRTQVGIDMVQAYIGEAKKDDPFARRMSELLTVHREMTRHMQTIESVRTRLADYRERMDELHVQLLDLESVKSKGELMTHLKGKMKDISERVQQATIDLVDLEEKAMLARLKFQDGIMELSMSEVIARR